MDIGIITSSSNIHDSFLRELEASEAIIISLGKRAVICVQPSQYQAVEESASREGISVEKVAQEIDLTHLYLIVQEGRLFQRRYPNVKIIADTGRYLIAIISPDELENIHSMKSEFGFMQITGSLCVFSTIQRDDDAARDIHDIWVQNFVDSVSQTEYNNTMTHLTTYPTRYSTSSHFIDAATWCEGQLSSMGYSTSVQNIPFGSGTTRNVIADKQGLGTGPKNLVLVVAHLDSINSSGGPSALAPGADDNATGSTAVLELARVMAGALTEHDLRLVLFGGEEQGLIGSEHYVSSLSVSDKSRIAAVINIDMIGVLNTEDPTVLIEGAPVSQDIVNDLADIASTYTSLTVNTSLFPYASDHVSFIDDGLPAILAIEGNDGANDYIHSDQDTLDHIDDNLALEITKMIVGFTATKLNKKGGVMNNLELVELVEAPLFYPQWSGRYIHNRSMFQKIKFQNTYLVDPQYYLKEPLILKDIQLSHGSVLPHLKWPRYSIKLHVDIDRTDPLNVVSGTVQRIDRYFNSQETHFIGRVTSDTASFMDRSLIIEDFQFQWPGTQNIVDRLEMKLTNIFNPTAKATFQSKALGTIFGPYSFSRESKYFREIELEIDKEDDAQEFEPFGTHTHPTRPDDLQKVDMTFAIAYAKAGIGVSYSSGTNTISTVGSGGVGGWTTQELHDAMETNWSDFENKAQWKTWLFLAENCVNSSTAGIMFDGNINEPGGVDRQGTALFTSTEWLFAESGAYSQANPPEAESVKRELFFTAVHEAGHTFNLFHPWQKTLYTPWTPPDWADSMTNNDDALTWMNYPENPTPGYSAEWFYENFYYRFTDSENLFLRHAPEQYVQQGNEDWGVNHGRAIDRLIDRRLELQIRSRRSVIETGEAVFVELRLHNCSSEPVSIHDLLDPSYGFVHIGITSPDGVKVPLVPLDHIDCRKGPQLLEPGKSVYESVQLTVGKFGFHFKKSGPYRIEVCYTNVDGKQAAAVMQLWVKPPANIDDQRVLSELYNARIGRALYFKGTRNMEDVNEKLEWIVSKIGPQHPAQCYLNTCLALPYSKPYRLFKTSPRQIEIADADPEKVVKHLSPVVKDLNSLSDQIGHIECRKVVDAYSACMRKSRNKAAANRVRADLLTLYSKRGVIDTVLQEIEKELELTKQT